MPGASIELVHEKLLADAWRAYNVVVDGQERGTIRNGGSLSLELDPGHHTVLLRIDWCSSRPLEIDLDSGERVRLVCRPNAKPWSVIYWSLLRHDDYIALSRA